VRRLRAAGVGSPEAEARWLVDEAAPELDGPVTARGLAHLEAMLLRREAGEPLQYVLGRWGFRHLDLLVDPRVLIPRPETEVVVEVALAEVRRLDGRVAVDLGTGSGAIALSLAVEERTLEVLATDRSGDALAVARANLAGIGRAGARMRLFQGDWFAALPEAQRGVIDLIVTNPPYVAEGDHLPAEVAGWEPQSALFGGVDGLDDIRQILAAAPGWLRRPGVLVLELAPSQASSATELAFAAGFAEAEVRPDLTGRSRVLVARL
jgi:release factor glutamine methyltransferase